jgi:hypothetical protein
MKKVRIIGGIIMIGENRNTGREKRNCPIACLYTTNLTWTGLELNPDLRGDRSVSNRLSHGAICFVDRLSSYRAVNIHNLVYKNQSVNIHE